MKHILKIAEIIGTEFRTRKLVEELSAYLKIEDEYLFDMSGIELISRSAADELYNLTHKYKVEIVHMTSFVQQMYDAVMIGRFTPRNHIDNDVTFVKCKDMSDLHKCFLMISKQ